MQIINTYPTNQNNYYAYNKSVLKNRKTVSSVYKSNSQISFNGVWGLDLLYKSLKNNPLKSFETFSEDEYLSLSNSQLAKLRLEAKISTPLHFSKIADMHVIAAQGMKNVLDRRFGKDNYVVVPIGRSISSIGKMLEFLLGKDRVENIPMSRMNRFYTGPIDKDGYKLFLEEVQQERGFDDFLKYLKSRHLSREDVETSGKNYILTDYCYSGASLDGAEQLFKSDLVWGNQKHNIFAVDFVKMLKYVDLRQDCRGSEKFRDMDFFRSELAHMFCYSKFKKYATVDRAATFEDVRGAASGEYLKNVPMKIRIALFRMIDVLMANKQESPVIRHRFDIDDFVVHIKNRRIEPWNDSETQYYSDIVNSLNEINKFLLSYDKIFKNKNSSEELLNIKNELEDYSKYMIISSKADSNGDVAVEFYRQYKTINCLIKKANMLLKKEI